MDKIKNKKYSVLMSVYNKENPVFLRESMQSIYDQTIPADDFVLICDGPLTKELNKVINEMQKKFGKRLRVIRQNKNHGLGYALNLGVKECKYDLIARMDSDDIAVEERCEKELAVFELHPEISIVGGFVGEFDNFVDNMSSIRKVPKTNEKIIEFAKNRNPFNHPSVMFRREDVIRAGNYQNIRFCQDYFLWINLLAEGYKGYNLQEVLVYMREDKNTFRRRSGREYFKIQKELFNMMREKNFLTYPQYVRAMMIRFGSAYVPNWLRQALFKKFMREKGQR